MKKVTLSGIIVAVGAVLLSVVQTAYAADTITIDNRLFSDNFESYNVGDAPDNATYSGFNDISLPTATVYSDNGNKVLNLSCDKDNTSEKYGEIAYSRRFGASGGSWKMNVTDNCGSGVLGLGFRGTSSVQKLFPLIIDGGEFKNGITGEYLLDCNQNQNYAIEFLYNPKNGTLEILIDGSRAVSFDWTGVSNAPDLSASTTTLRMKLEGSTEYNTSYFIDDLVLSEPKMQIDNFAYFDESGEEMTSLKAGEVTVNAEFTNFEAQSKKIGIFNRVSNGKKVVEITYSEFVIDGSDKAKIQFSVPDGDGYEAETIIVLPDDDYRPICRSIKIN